MTDFETAGMRGDWDVRELVDLSPYPMYVRDRDALLFVNAAFADLLAYESVEALMAVGQFSALVHPDQRDAFRLRLGVGSVGPGTRATLLGNDGREVVVDVVARFIVWGGRKVRYGILTDQTQRVQAERALTDSEERYRRLVVDSRNGVCVELDGHIVFANGALAKLTGHGRPESMLGMPTLFADTPARLTTTRGGAHEVEMTTRAGHQITVLVSTHIIPWEGREALQREVVDITRVRRVEAERKVLQHQLIQNQKMQAIGELTGGLAHDFNNMLSPMLGFAELIERKARRADDHQLLEFITQIQAAGRRAQDLVAQMLLFARGSDAETESLALGPHLARSLKFVQAMLPSSIDLRWEIEDEVSLVRVNPNQLDQVLMNLCLNAAQAVDGQGAVTARASCVEVQGPCTSCGQEFSGVYAAITVEDAGTAPAASEIPRMFEPFYSTRDVGEGSGMGLSVVHGIAHQAGGHVIASPSELGGLKMQLYLPVAGTATTPVAAGRHEAHAGHASAPARYVGSRTAEQFDPASAGTVLVVDDEPAIVQLIAAAFRNEGLRFKTFSRADELLRAFHANPDAAGLLLTDQTMPRMDGIELIDAVRATRADLPIILCSGYEESPRIAKYRDDAAFVFMRKPVQTRELLLTVRRLLEPRSSRGRSG